MAWEGVVGEQQQPEVRLVALQPALVAAHEVRDVVGHHSPAFLPGAVEELAVVDAAKMGPVGVLYGDDVVAAVASAERRCSPSQNEPMSAPARMNQLSQRSTPCAQRPIWGWRCQASENGG
jgi:hypothetical protein